jgi:hypothetical protein
MESDMESEIDNAAAKNFKINPEQN